MYYTVTDTFLSRTMHGHVDSHGHTHTQVHTGTHTHTQVHAQQIHTHGKFRFHARPLYDTHAYTHTHTLTNAYTFLMHPSLLKTPHTYTHSCGTCGVWASRERSAEMNMQLVRTHERVGSTESQYCVPVNMEKDASDIWEQNSYRYKVIM